MENKTIVDYMVILLNYFANNIVFNSSKYRDLLGLTAKDPDEEKAMVLLALQELEKNGIIKSISINKKNQLWALYKPLSSVAQTTNISYTTSSKIAETINSYCEKFKDSTDFCDPKNIQEKDILNLIVIINYLIIKLNASKETI